MGSGGPSALAVHPRQHAAFGWSALYATTADAAAWLPPLLEELRSGDSVHSWRRHVPASGPIGVADAARMLEREQALRPTVTFTYVAERPDGHREIVAAATVAEGVRADFPFEGFPVLARCYVRDVWRGIGLYRVILRHRYEYCVSRWGDRLRAIHLGSAEPAVWHVAMTTTELPAPFVHIGDENLEVAGEVHRVKDLLAFAPGYARQLLDEARELGSGADAVACRRLAADLVEAGCPAAGVVALRDRVEALMSASGRHLNGSNPALRSLFALARAIPVVR